MNLRTSPGIFRHLLNWWSPFRGAGVRVTALAADWSYARAELRMGLLNRNAFGAHFGGSLFSMTDPFHALMLTHRLGPDYLVADQAAEIEFVRPGRGVVSAEFHLDAHLVERLKREAADGSKLLPEFQVEVRDRAGELVARVRKRVYVRLKRRARPATPGP